MPLQTLQETVATATAMPWVPLNVHEDDSPVRFVLNKSANFARTYQVQFTLDKVMEQGVSAFPVTAFEATDATSGTLNHPMAAVRIRVVSGSGSATTSFRVLQGGI